MNQFFFLYTHAQLLTKSQKWLKQGRLKTFWHIQENFNLINWLDSESSFIQPFRTDSSLNNYFGKHWIQKLIYTWYDAIIHMKTKHSHQFDFSFINNITKVMKFFQELLELYRVSQDSRYILIFLNSKKKKMEWKILIQKICEAYNYWVISN